jgi:hypothetical protein
MKFAVADVHKNVLSYCEFHENWCKYSCIYWCTDILVSVCLSLLLLQHHSLLGRHEMFHNYSYGCEDKCQCGQVTATSWSKKSHWFHCFLLKPSFWEYWRSGPRIMSHWCGKMILWGAMHLLISSGRFFGTIITEWQLHKKTRKEMMDRGFILWNCMFESIVSVDL